MTGFRHQLGESCSSPVPLGEGAFSSKFSVITSNHDLPVGVYFRFKYSSCFAQALAIADERMVIAPGAPYRAARHWIKLKVNSEIAPRLLPHCGQASVAANLSSPLPIVARLLPHLQLSGSRTCRPRRALMIAPRLWPESGALNSRHNAMRRSLSVSSLTGVPVTLRSSAWTRSKLRSARLRDSGKGSICISVAVVGGRNGVEPKAPWFVRTLALSPGPGRKKRNAARLNAGGVFYPASRSAARCFNQLSTSSSR